MAGYAGLHKQDAWAFEVFFHPYSDHDGARGWYWWQCALCGTPLTEENPSGPFDEAQDAHMDATDYDLAAC